MDQIMQAQDSYTLAFLKAECGAQFIRDLGFCTKNADETYGLGWLDRTDV